ncbi:2-amino-4-hydroxy-6-hydroxymethyldihydropteridine diphosphokinase [Kiritimatiella glycovorans]|uniref:2-amino-4-hydroxy-6-hydroxymethyldihydropteridine pyrophosphokinase n=1 Tax=Kiritimatiella glycovorans TaxID=1307763 RepID=A0A0G3EHX3_9BACT|nr:2-amino-4-hydroxy-6-hydroxymethyldihydropteridine diphosphokinase [Kiritimatiella glycovorans]AKJ64405.1 Bifunctional folate synthesis protein [Kiritimatiella glycovorans]
MEAAFSLGSNRGDRLAHLSRARDLLAATEGAALAAQSRVYETEPVGVRPEFSHLFFLNAVVIVESEYGPERWKARIGEIEDALGRVRSDDRYAPRNVDVDLLYVDDLVRSSADLTVPHPRWRERKFVVRPLCDVRPDAVLPGETRRVARVLEELEDPAGIELFAEKW